ncbi:radical SAM protein [Candidatus Microgenomates bacterium]|nr:radical SAM protein [Candidatus Microgenomates bacterium]
MERSTFTDAKSKLEYHPQTVERLLNNEPVIPISMEVDLSYFCGDQCTFCHFSYTHQKPVRTDALLPILEKVFMPPKLADEVLRKMNEAGVKSIVFSGGGEPTDSPFALEIFKMAKSYNLELGMYTRGFNLKGELGEFVANNFEWVVVSLDVTNPEEHKLIKGTNGKIFLEKLENIHNFLKIPNRHANISVSAMVDTGHLENVPPYPEQQDLFGTDATQVTKLERDMLWLLGLGADEVQIRPIIDTGSYKEQRESHQMKGMAFMTDKQIWQEHYSWIPKVVSILERYNSLAGLNTSIDKFHQVYEGESGEETCYGMVISAGLVASDGKVYKCVNTRSIPEKIIGDLKTQSMEEIFLSESLDRSIDSFCRVGCRGCKVNEVFNRLSHSETVFLSPRQGVKHPNFI